jgi:hypothetical protein
MIDEYEQAIDEEDELTTEPEQSLGHSALFDEPAGEATDEGVRVYERIERRLLSPWLALLLVLLALVATWLIFQTYR